jgi:hypothetical protein
MSLRSPRRSPVLGLGLVLAVVASAPDVPQPKLPGEAPPTRVLAEPIIPPLSFVFVPAPMTPELTALAEARYQAAQRQYEELWLFYREARTDTGPVYLWSRLMIDSRRDLCRTKAEWITVLEEHRDRMIRMQALVKRVNRTGFARKADVKGVDYYHAEADYWLARARSS